MKSTLVIMVAIFGLFGAILLAPQATNAQSISTLTCDNGGDYHQNTDSVNIGDTTSEIGHILSGYGWSDPIIHSGGSSYGYGDDGNFRMVIEKTCDKNNDKSAFFTLDAGDNGAKLLTVRHLDGLSNDDSFEVYINKVPIDSYTDKNDSTEEWYTAKFPLDESMKGVLTIEIRATDEIWGGCDDWGQLAISFASLDTCSIPDGPDLTIEKSVDVTEANPGDTLNYTIVVKNTGDQTAFDVKVDDILPEGLIYQLDGTTAKQWKLDTILRDKSKTIEYVVIIEDDAVTRDYTNIASVEAVGLTAVKDDATTAVAEEVLIPIVLGEEALPSLTIDKTASVEFANPGDTISYTIVITNDGDSMAVDTVLIDHIAAGMQFTDTLAPTHTWMLGIIAPGNSVTTTYDVIILKDNEPGIYRNTAEVWAQGVANVFDTADVELRAVVVLGEELPVTGGSTMTFAYLIGAGLLLIFSGVAMKLTVAKK